MNSHHLLNAVPQVCICFAIHLLEEAIFFKRLTEQHWCSNWLACQECG